MKRKNTNVANKAYKFRIYPNEEQQVLINKTFGCVRFIWNTLLGDYNKQYEETGKGKLNTPAKYKEFFVWLKEVDSLALCNVQLSLSEAFKNFFENPKHFGLPQFKSKKKCKNSYTTNFVNNNIKISKEGITLPKLGCVKTKLHRPLPTDAVLKGATVSQTKTGKYFVSLLFEYENQVSKREDLNNSLGLDMMLNGLYMDSNGTSAEMPHFYRRVEKKLAGSQRKLSNLYAPNKEQSKRYYKQKVKVAKIHEKLYNQRIDFLHKLSLSLVSEYDYIFIEDLDLDSMKQDNHGKSVSEISWSKFVNMMLYKAEMYGCNIVKVDKFYPSTQICSSCGAHTGKKDITIREWKCPECGSVHDRDHNSAINILIEGKRIVLSTRQ